MVLSPPCRSTLATGALLLAAAPAAAQSVHGRIVEESGAAVSGAFIGLLDASGVQRDADLTDPDGAFVLVAPAPGEYTIGIERIGYRSTRSDPIRLAAGQILQHTLSVRVEPIELAGIGVRIETDCRVRPGEGGASRLWQEARKALSLTALTQERGLLRHAITTHERTLDPGDLRVLEERSRSRTGVSRGSPYVGMPPVLLARVGFVRFEGEETVYDGPDADHLLSDEFLDGHCFEVREPPADRPGWIGLGFEPVRDRRLPEIAGTMWLDAETAELRVLEYDYVNLPRALERKGAGGWIEFDRVESGEWYVARWWIRMPVVRVAERTLSDHRTMEAAPRTAEVAWIQEAGGRVDRIEPLRTARRPAARAWRWSEPLELPPEGAPGAPEEVPDRPAAAEILPPPDMGTETSHGHE